MAITAVTSLNQAKPDYFIAAIALVLIILSLIVFWESLGVLRQQKRVPQANG